MHKIQNFLTVNKESPMSLLLRSIRMLAWRGILSVKSLKVQRSRKHDKAETQQSPFICPLGCQRDGKYLRPCQVSG